MLDPQKLRSSFQQLCGRESRLFSAPGRVNLIGEHTDYNEGFVLPLAADLRTYVAAAPRNDSLIRLHSFDLHEDSGFDLEAGPKSPRKGWTSYVEGVARVLAEKGFKLRGADIAISSEVPIGAGLSSSAALEISFGFALLMLGENKINLMELALSAQTAEHRFVGTLSGLMDQLTAAFAVRNRAMLIDCRSLERTLTPLNIPEFSVVVCNTMVKHELATSGYNKRRDECREALTLLRRNKASIRSLRDITLVDLEASGDLLSETLRRRCRHVISENERTLRAAEALKNRDSAELGELMNLSHESLRDDYEVSCRELDIMVELARREHYVTGARMMGGGFGGCTVNLVRRDNLDQFRQFISAEYEQAVGLVPSIIPVTADDGVGEIT
jgi:galactokinase